MFYGETMQVTVKRTINTRAWEGLNNKIEKKLSMQVGWFPSARYDNATPVAAVAVTNEFGNAPIPARPFMRPAARQNANAWAKLFAKDIRQLPLQYALDNLGFRVEGDIRKSISAVWNPPLKAVTIYNRIKKHDSFIKRDKNGQIDWIKTEKARDNAVAKAVGTHAGIAKPLIDTGYMIASVTHEVSE